jgi:hypothetical protein
MDYCKEGQEFRYKMHEIHTNEQKYPGSKFKAAAYACLEEFEQHLATCETCRQAHNDAKQQS